MSTVAGCRWQFLLRNCTGRRGLQAPCPECDKWYRYYISEKLVTGVTRAVEKQRTWRVPALQLEGAIFAAVQKRITKLSEAANVQQFSGTETPVPDAKEALNVVERVRIASGQLTVDLDLSRFDAAPVTHLSGLSFEGQGAFPAQC